MKRNQSNQKLNVLIVGAGKGGTALLSLFREDPDIKIAGVVDINKKAPGLKLAQKLRLPTYNNFRKALTSSDVNLIIDVTGRSEVLEELRKIRPPKCEIVGPNSARMMWKLIEEKKKGIEDLKVLYQIGLLLASVEDMDEVLYTIVSFALKLTHSPAGSLALYDKVKNEFSLAVAIGFSSEFSKVSRWTLRPGGLTSFILSRENPTIIPDVSLEPTFNNPVMLKEGIKSLVAIPLLAQEKKIIGILYVDDFIPRSFTLREINILSLLANQATIALEKAQLLEQIKDLAITDGLTNLLNHRFFHERLDEELNRAKRFQRALSLIIFDIDYFKNYNDYYGHLKGDLVLKKVAKTIENLVRKVDLAARYGGEEFTVVLPETEREEALNVGERIRKAIEFTPFPGEEIQPKGKLTISGGVATYPRDARNKEELIEKADKAMYEAKKRGRNKVLGYSQLLPLRPTKKLKVDSST